MNRLHFLNPAQKVMACLMPCFFALMSFAQQSVFEYDIIRNNKVIGHSVVTGVQENGKVTYRISSEIRLNIIKEFIARSAEETVFEKGVMTSSSVYRTFNGHVKAKRNTRLINTVYHLEDEEKNKSIHSVKVMHTTNSLCLNEPVNQAQVYSEYFQQWLKISAVKLHSYKLTLPDGNYTVYHYRNGICTKIDIYQTLYNLTLTLRNQGQERTNIPISSSY